MPRKIIIILSVLIIVSGWLNAQEMENEEFFWQNPRLVRVQSKELAFSKTNYSHPKKENYLFYSRFNNGWVLMLWFFRIKGLFFDKWGIYVTVSDPNGRSFLATHEMVGSNVYSDTARLFISDGENTIQGSNMLYRIQFNFNGFSCNLLYENILPPWKPGDGIEYLTPDKRAFQYQVIISPWASVTGFICVEGKKIEVKGQGFGEKSLIVNSLRKLDPILYSLRLYSPEEIDLQHRWSIDLFESITHPDYGSKRIPRLALAHGNDWVFTTRNYATELSEFKRIENIPYEYPQRLRIIYEANGFKLEGEYVSEKLFTYIDALFEVPRLVRVGLLLFVKRPVSFLSLGEFEGILSMPDGTVEHLHLFGVLEYTVAK